MELLMLLGFNAIMGIVILFVGISAHSDTFGHYLRPYQKNYIHWQDRERGIVANDMDFSYIKEPCNPYLSFFHLCKYKGPLIVMEYEDDLCKMIWDGIPPERAKIDTINKRIERS